VVQLVRTSSLTSPDWSENFPYQLWLLLCDYRDMAKWFGAHYNQEFSSTVKFKKGPQVLTSLLNQRQNNYYSYYYYDMQYFILGFSNIMSKLLKIRLNPKYTSELLLWVPHSRQTWIILRLSESLSDAPLIGELGDHASFSNCPESESLGDLRFQLNGYDVVYWRFAISLVRY